MTASDSWQENNTRRLGGALAELRRRLEDPGRPSEQGARPKGFAAAPSRELNRSEEPLSALELLGDRLGLSPFEQNVLLLCAAMELDTRMPGLCARAQDDPQKNFPTFGLALALFDEPSWDALSPERPLRFWRLIEISQVGAQPLTASALRADERIVNYVKGLNYLDERLASLLAPLDAPAAGAELAPSQESVARIILRRWQQSAGAGVLPVAQLVGADVQSKQLVAHHAAAALNRRLYWLPVESLPAHRADLELFVRLWQRESRLLPMALYLDAEESNGPAERSGALGHFLSRGGGVVFLGAREMLGQVGCPHFALDVTKPTAAEQKAAWVAALGDFESEPGGADDSGQAKPSGPGLERRAESAALGCVGNLNCHAAAARLAGQFNLNLARIHELSRQAKLEARSSGSSLAENLWEACRASERPRLDALAQRLEPKMTWDDLVLPAHEMNQLRQLAAQVAHRNQVYCEWGFERKMNRGFGISALFAGDSGTGKTMAAEVIANELRLNLYRIDLSAVVNKYIGETEKNLRRLFDAAEGGGVILFFDEADALFGKRSEVKDSHDRYANVEINYLLQRVESYRGLAILATNTKSALDTAFLRRLRFVVNFPYPGSADRRRLWEKVFMQADAKDNLAAPPLEKLDYDRLAKLNLAGGHIHNAALNAAFRAAAEGASVTMRLVLDAVRTELLKLDRPVNEADFRWNEPKLDASSAVERFEEPALA